MAMDFAQMGQMMKLAQKIDFEKVGKLAEKVDLNQLLELAGSMDPATMQKLLKAAKSNGTPKELPAANGDFFDISGLLTDEQRAVQQTVRGFMETEVEPIINEYWSKDEFPKQLIPRFAALNLTGAVYDGVERRADGSVMEGILTMEMARIDPSVATFFGVQCGLAMGSIYACGSAEQKAAYMPKMQKMEILGCFGLTEPKVGSGAAGGLTTTCRRNGDEWTINGQKKWIGNSTFADIAVIWARDEADDEVKGFIAETKTAGFAVEKQIGKIALRSVENGQITMTDVKVPESMRLPNARSFKDTGTVLRMTRAGVAWIAVGLAMGVYEKALKYAQTRKQFGRKIGGFQLIQAHLVHMLGNVTAMQTMAIRLSQLQDADRMLDEHASLAKVFCCAKARETAALAREVHGGNGILLEHHVARLFCDVEAVYSYEGTNEVNTLIVGRAITGFSAFV